MDSILVRPNATLATHDRAQPAVADSSDLSRGPVIANVPRSQLYYWSAEWQRLEREALSEIAEGKAVRFPTPEAAVRWLFSED